MGEGVIVDAKVSEELEFLTDIHRQREGEGLGISSE